MAGIGVGNLATPDDPGIVDQDANRADLAPHPRGQPVALRPVSDIAGKPDRTAADRLRGAARRLAIHIDRNQPRPASAIARAIASPMPDPAPVTSAILPSSNPATGYRLRWELDTGEGRYPWRKWVPAFAGTCA